jgi:hypothetical protein
VPHSEPYVALVSTWIGHYLSLQWGARLFSFCTSGAEGQKAIGDVWSQSAISDPILNNFGKTDCQRVR